MSRASQLVDHVATALKEHVPNPNVSVQSSAGITAQCKALGFFYTTKHVAAKKRRHETPMRLDIKEPSAMAARVAEY